MAKSPEQKELEENRARLNAELSWQRIEAMKKAWALVKEHDIADPRDPDAYFEVTTTSYKEVFRILNMDEPDIPDDLNVAVVNAYPSLSGRSTPGHTGPDFQIEEVTPDKVPEDEWQKIEAARSELPPD